MFTGCRMIRNLIICFLSAFPKPKKLYSSQIIVTARTACGRVYVTVWCPSVRLSVCLSVPAIDRCSSVRRVCCRGTGGQRVSIDCCTAHSSKCASSVTFIADVEGSAKTCCHYFQVSVFTSPYCIVFTLFASRIFRSYKLHSATTKFYTIYHVPILHSVNLK